MEKEKTNKNGLLVVIGVIAIAVILLGKTLLSGKQTPVEIETVAGTSHQQSEDEMHDEDMMIATGYLMQDGKMVIEEGENLSPMTTDVSLNDGTEVSVLGGVTRPDGSTLTLSEGQSIGDDGSIMEPEEMMTAPHADGQMESLESRYLKYSEDALRQATKDHGRAILFFAALGWCPSCQAADKDFQTNFSDLPPDVSILKVNYDHDSAMKQKYDITMQDTFIQVDSKGQEITRWNSGGRGVSSVLKNIQ